MTNRAAKAPSNLKHSPTGRTVKLTNLNLMNKKGLLQTTRHAVFALLGALTVILPHTALYGGQTGSVSTAPQQRTEVKGVVKDAAGAPMSGVTVTVKNSTTGTATSADGSYTIAVPGSNPTLVFSYIGYNTVEEAVNGRSVVDVTMEEDTTVLDDVVVIGYGTMKAKEVTSAISHVSSDEFLSISSNNPMMLIQGKVAGVSVSQTAAADPNAGTSVQIRGVSSRQAGLGPLYVVDGIPNGNLQNINPNDILSMDILKDGAASAIYGTRASNGVIIISTKQGARDGRIHTSYNGYVSMDFINNKPDLLTASEFRQYRVPDGATDWGSDTDWFDLVTRKGYAHSHAVTVSGGTQKFNYRGTMDYRDAKGVDIRSGRQEYGARINLNHGTAKDLLRFSVMIAPRVVNSDFSSQGAIDLALRANPTYPLMDPQDPLLYNPFTPGLPTGPNPVETLSLIEDGVEMKFLDWNASAALNLLELIMPKYNTNQYSWDTQVTVGQNILDNFNYFFEPSTTSSMRRLGVKGWAQRIYSKGSTSNLEWTTNARVSFNDHTISGLFGYSYNYEVNSGMSARNRNFPSDALSYNGLGQGDNEILEHPEHVGMMSDKADSRLIGFFGRLMYNYKERYMLTASLRYEGSSRFGALNKWGYFPAVSAGWRISEEPWMKGAKWVNDLKLRGDFGVTGNQNFGNYMSLVKYKQWGQTYYGGEYVASIGPDGNINSKLRWEKAINWNIGLDFSLFGNILTGSINYYNRTQKDLLGLYDAPIPPNIENKITANVGTMRNTGLEFEFDIRAVKSKNWSYTIGLTAETMQNEFVSFSNDIYQSSGWEDRGYLGLGDFGMSKPIQRLAEGKRVGEFYMWSYAGLDENGNIMVYDADNNVISSNGAPDDARRYVGNGLPKFRMSMTHNLRYRNFDLTLSFRGAFGFHVFNTLEYAFGQRKANVGYNAFRKAYDFNADINSSLGASVPTDYFLSRGDYFKLDVATLGYTLQLPKSRILSGIRVYVTGRNLFTVKGYDGPDPDFFPVNGLEPGVLPNTNYYPSTTQVVFGAQLNF